MHPPRPVAHPAAPPSPPCRLQELEDQYRREREEATYLLEQQRLVRVASGPCPRVPCPHGLHSGAGWGNQGPCFLSPALSCPEPWLWGGPVQAHRVGGLGEPEPQPCLRARTTRASWRPCRSRWAPGTAQRRTRRRRSRRTKVSALQSGAGPGPRAGRGLREDTAPGRSLELCWSAPSPWGPRPACPRGKASLSPGGGIRGGEGRAAAGTPQARACAHRQEQPGPWGGGCERGLQAGDLCPLTRVLPAGGGASPGRGHSAPHLATFFPNGGLGG